MKIDLMNSTGQQIQVTINEFAEALSKGTVYGLAKRYYNAPTYTNIVLESLSDYEYHRQVWKADPKQLAGYLQSLEEVNDEFEYTIAYSPNRVEIEEYVSMSFTRQGDTVLVEIH